jgi:hypothetical protein
MKHNFIFITGVLGALLFIIASILGGMQIQGYSFISQYISESYASGVANTAYLRYMYIASGLLIALFAFMAPSTLPKGKGIKIGFFVFAIFYGLGTVTTGIFPCDIGCNPDPEKASFSQFIHTTVGFLVYAVVPFCLMGIGFSAKKVIKASKLPKVSIICGGIALAFVLLLFSNPTGPFIGLLQRVIECSILFWIFNAAFHILRKKH